MQYNFSTLVLSYGSTHPLIVPCITKLNDVFSLHFTSHREKREREKERERGGGPIHGGVLVKPKSHRATTSCDGMRF